MESFGLGFMICWTWSKILQHTCSYTTQVPISNFIGAISACSCIDEWFLVGRDNSVLGYNSDLACPIRKVVWRRHSSRVSSTRRWLPKRKLKIYCDLAVTKFATLGDFLVCRLSLHLHNIEIYRQRGLESNIVGYILLSYIKGFHVAIVETQKNLQHLSSDSIQVNIASALQLIQNFWRKDNLMKSR